jgi:hypothetical protein
MFDDTRIHPLLVAGQRVAFEDDTEWLVERVTPCAASVRCVAGKPAQVRHVDFKDDEGVTVRSVDFLSRAGERMTISAHSAVRLLGLILLAGVLAACGSGLTALTEPTPVYGAATPLFAAASVRPLADLSIQIEVIPDQEGAGFLWLKAHYSVNKPGCQPPEFSVSPSTAMIYAYDEDPYIAYVGGVPGSYVVSAKGCGASGSLTVEYEGAQP